MKKERIIVAILLALVGVLTIEDMIEDTSEGANISHLLVECAIALSSFIVLIIIRMSYIKERKRNQMLENERMILEEIADKYQQKSKVFVEGLSVHIDKEFKKWKLSEAERDVALFLLKGISPKKISEIRNSAEKTVRHQINSIYKKAGLGGREELTAYFLEDLLPPLNQ
jgi:DNA-binding CsgD family transcriptional regulator